MSIKISGKLKKFDGGLKTSTGPASYSVAFDGDGDYITTPSSSSLSAWSTDFTVECWLYPNTFSELVIWSNSTSVNDGYTGAYAYTDGRIGMGRLGINEIASVSPVLSLSQWHHLAFTRNGSSIYIYVDGNQVATGGTSRLETSTTRLMTIGGTSYNSPNCSISNFRVVKGTAVYTSNFTVPTSPLTEIANTQLLTCQSSSIVDISSTGHSLTVFGNPVVETTNPFQ